MDYNRHYICLDANNSIINGFSDAFEQPQSGNICINESGGRHFELFDKINPSLQNMDGVYLYHYIDGQVVAKTLEEIQAEIDALPQSKPEPDKSKELEGLVYYIGMMTGVL